MKTNKITGKPLKFDLSAQSIDKINAHLSLDVEPNAEFQANPIAWFGKAFLESGSRNSMRILTGIKEKTKLAILDTGDVIKEYGCAFTPGDINLDAKVITVCPITIQKGFCQSEVETSFESQFLAKGSNGNITTQALLDYMLDRLAKKADEELELLTWQGSTGDIGATGSGFLEYCDGLQVKLADDNDILHITASASVTAANIVTELNKVVAKIPAKIRFKPELIIRMSSDVMSAYLQYYFSTIAPQYNGLNKELVMAYAGIKLEIAPGMSARTMVAALSGQEGDLIYATDVDSDAKDLRVVDFSKTTLDDNIGIRANAKIGFHYTNPEQIVFYSPLV